MPTSKDISKHTRVSPELQKELAQYGLLRTEVMEQAPPKANGGTNFFGIKYEGEKPSLAFGVSVGDIEKREMMVGMTAPEDRSFNMLMTEDFERTVKTANKQDLRSYLRRLVDRVRN